MRSPISYRARRGRAARVSSLGETRLPSIHPRITRARSCLEPWKVIDGDPDDSIAAPEQAAVEHRSAQQDPVVLPPDDDKQASQRRGLAGSEYLRHSRKVGGTRQRHVLRVGMPHPNKLHRAAGLFLSLLGCLLGALDTADELLRRTHAVGRRPNHVIDPDYAERVIPLAEEQAAGFALSPPLPPTLPDGGRHLLPRPRGESDLVIILAY